MITPTDVIRARLRRLVTLQGSDPGFYVLAAHSFIEVLLREMFERFERRYYLKDLLWDFREQLKRSVQGYIKNFGALNELAKAHDVTNEVRHAFRSLAVEEARATTHRLLAFCDLAGLPKVDELKTLKESLKLWDQRSSRQEAVSELNRLGFELHRLKKEHKDLEREVQEYRAAANQREKLGQDLRRLEEELERERSSRRKKDERVDELRKQRSVLLEQTKALTSKVESLDAAREYVLGLTRMTLYTRSRLDYERELVRLTREQQQILDEITLGGDFLVKGGAGTGKTLVLLSALGKLLARKKEELDLGMPAPTFVLLTYSDTLVKYDRYIAGLIAIEEREERILSVDEYLNGKFQAAFPGWTVDEAVVKSIQPQIEYPDFMTDDELEMEIEHFIFANNVTKREYCVDAIERSGMKRRLTLEQRRRVWEARSAFVEHMQRRGKFTPNYSRVLLAGAVKERPALATEDYAFVDEVQDLVPCDLMAIKSLARTAVIMAGDNDQAIFRKGFSFKRAGIDIVGKSRTIRLNFRNTVQINELAERFRKRIPELSDDGEGIITAPRPAAEWPSQAFRPGPEPELFKAVNAEALVTQLLRRIGLFTDTLGYDAENLAILAPDSLEVDRLRETLMGEGLTCAVITDKEFRFDSTAGIRLSTLHLAKGIDFPVVLLYLPRESTQPGAYDGTLTDKMRRSLLYVCMTRAMEHLNVFLLSGDYSPVVQDLVACFEERSK